MDFSHASVRLAGSEFFSPNQYWALPAIVIRKLLEFQIRRRGCLVKLFGRFVELSIAISGCAGVEVQPRVIAVALKQVLILL
jgi:hypothetical protein